jgi:hypothetical protein
MNGIELGVFLAALAGVARMARPAPRRQPAWSLEDRRDFRWALPVAAIVAVVVWILIGLFLASGPVPA